jgi:hypothetical protein
VTRAQSELFARWESFLAKIMERLAEILAESHEAAAEIIAAHPTDLLPLGNLVSGLEHRIDELRTRIEETWDQQVEPKFQELDEDGFWDRGLDRKDDALQDVRERWELAKTRMQADVFRNVWPLAQAELARPVVCRHCGAGLTVRARHEPESVKCGHCGAVNQVLPGPAIALYHGSGRAFAEEQALPLRFAVERFRMQVDRWRRDRDWASEPLESLEKWHALELAYWQRYAQVCGGDAALIESYMSQFRKWNLETEQAWVRAHGTR